MVVIAIGSVLPTVASFIDWAILLMVGFFFYYVFEAVTFQKEQEKEDEEKGRKAFVKGIQKSIKKSADKKELEKRLKLTDKPRGHLIYATEACSDIINAISATHTPKTIRRAKESFKVLKKDARHINHEFNHIVRHDRSSRSSIARKMFESSGDILNRVHSIKIPSLAEMNSEASALNTKVTEIKNLCYKLIDDLDTYVKRSKKRSGDSSLVSSSSP